MNSGAGPLRDRLLILRPVDRAHPSGAPCDSWQAVRRIWGAFEGFTGRLYLAALAEQSGLSARVRIRRRSDIQPGMRLQARGASYHIQAVQPDPDPAWLWLLLERIDGNG
ncbi:phage head closure protein [Aquitalea pelogenes]|uniref:phage head closure protein n=1 Tax=Aquitalea pelogenes TaxID=1293573 RepID=UPI0035AE70A0